VSESTRRPYRSMFFCVVLAALSAVGCASHRPLATAKVTQAERAVEDAQQAGAAVSAPLELRAAQDKLKAAQEAMAKGKHGRAIRSAEQATIDGEYARAVAAKQRVNTTSDEMDQYIKVLRQELDRLPK
jgi:cytochrome c biogenesis protein ResB